MMQKVMLACAAKLEQVKFPCYASPKIDGVRCHIELIDGKSTALTRANKRIPNEALADWLENYALPGFDGELTAGIPCCEGVYNHTVRIVMSHSNRFWDSVQFNVFDIITDEDDTFERRKLMLDAWGGCERLPDNIHFVQHVKLNDLATLLEFEKACLAMGYEGICIRSPNGIYKEGRSTIKEQYLLKIKRFVDDEATIIGFEEKMHNANELTTNELGYAKRSSSKENLVPAGTLGALKVRMGDVEFNIGSGFDEDTRRQIWDNQDAYLGKLVKFKHFAVGAKDAPRFPVFLGFRDETDL